MAHIAPVARWFGFGFGYTVAEAVALVSIARVSDRETFVSVFDVMTITLVAIAWGALVRTIFRIWRENQEGPAGPLGTYAKSKGQRGAGAVGTGHQSVVFDGERSNARRSMAKCFPQGRLPPRSMPVGD